MRLSGLDNPAVVGGADRELLHCGTANISYPPDLCRMLPECGRGREQLTESSGLREDSCH